MNDYAPSIAPIRQDAPDEIPVVDLSDFHAGAPGALARISAELRHALQDVGFYFVINHGVPESLIAGAFDAARRFHDQPEDTKLALRINQHNIGYLPFKSSVTRHSKLNDNNRPNLVEAFFIKRETPVDARVQPFRAPNRWPDNLPGFREAVLAYQNAMEALENRCYRFMPQPWICHPTGLTRPSANQCSRCGWPIIRVRTSSRKMSSG